MLISDHHMSIHQGAHLHLHTSAHVHITRTHRDNHNIFIQLSPLAAELSLHNIFTHLSINLTL